MKIAVGTDDRQTIRKGDFCESRYFMVFEILNAKVTASEVRDNKHPEERKAVEKHGQVEGIIHLLSDCGLFLAKDFYRDAADEIYSQGIDCITTRREEIDDAVDSYLDGKLEDFSYYSPDAKAHLPCTQRPYI